MTSPQHTVSHMVNLPYTRADLSALFASARHAGVDTEGRYTVSSCTIHVWSFPDRSSSTRQASRMVGSFYVNWIVYALQRIECDEGYCLADLLQELAILEHQALGRVKHGTIREGRQEHADPVE